VMKTCAHCGVNLTNKATYRNDNGQEYCSMSCLDGVGGPGPGPEMLHGMEYVP